jgi:hypothetical protein
VRTPNGTVPYPEVDAFETLLKYRTYNAGGCKIVSHPVWLTSVYPASLFAAAPVDVIVKAAQEAAKSVPVKERVVVVGGGGAAAAGGAPCCQ